MKILTISLPDRVVEIAAEEAGDQCIDITSLCGGVLSDYFLNSPVTKPNSAISTNPKPPPPKTESKFHADAEMPGFPSQSVRFAQQFVDEALKLPGVKVFKKSDNRGIGFEPNFVFIEYVMTMRSGIAVSFYGSPSQHANRLISKGRGTSYSRAKIYRQEDLDSILPHVRKAYEFKFGKM